MHAFLDLETLSLRPDAVITEIGAVEFDPRTFDLRRTLDLTLCADHQIMRGRHHDEDTILWHASNGTTIDLSAGLDLALALSRLHDWFSAVNPDFVWIWGPDFDRPVLESACREVDLELPWPYHRTMDARSFWNFAFPTTKRPKRPHHAFNDCVAAVNDLRTALQKLNLVELEVAYGD